MMENAAELAAGSWTHSFEEDTETEQVFRRTDGFTFPRSRRPRDVLDFGAAQLTTVVTGRDDKQQCSSSPLIRLGMQRYRLGDGRELEVVEAGADVLRVKLG